MILKVVCIIFTSFYNDSLMKLLLLPCPVFHELFSCGFFMYFTFVLFMTYRFDLILLSIQATVMMDNYDMVILDTVILFVYD